MGVIENSPAPETKNNLAHKAGGLDASQLSDQPLVKHLPGLVNVYITNWTITIFDG